MPIPKCRRRQQSLSPTGIEHGPQHVLLTALSRIFSMIITATPLSRVLNEKLTVLQLVEKRPSFLRIPKLHYRVHNILRRKRRKVFTSFATDIRRRSQALYQIQSGVVRVTVTRKTTPFYAGTTKYPKFYYIHPAVFTITEVQTNHTVKHNILMLHNIVLYFSVHPNHHWAPWFQKFKKHKYICNMQVNR